MSVERTGPIPARARRMIEARGRETRFVPRETLLRRGGTGREWFAITSGTVLVSVTSTQGSTLVLDTRTSGDLLGELAALEGAPRAATATAKTEVRALKLRHEDLYEILSADPDWAFALLQQLARQVRSMSQRYSLRSEDLRRRVSAMLLTHFHETGTPVLRSTREELACWIGATRESTCRALREMQDDGAVRLGRGLVEVVRPEALAT